MPTSEDHYREQYAKPAEEAAANAPAHPKMMDVLEYERQKREYRRTQYKALALGHLLDVVQNVIKWSAVSATVVPIARALWH